MTELTACYFCGTVDGPPSKHPVVPPELDPPAEEFRTVVVCPQCRTKLQTIQDLIAESVTGDAGEDESVTTSEPQPADQHRATRTESEPTAPPSPAPADEEQSESDTPATTAATVQSSDVDLPAGARRIEKLLRNREFPIDRADVEAIITNAYEFDLDQCTRAIDALVDAGVFVERDGQLDRPATNG